MSMPKIVPAPAIDASTLDEREASPPLAQPKISIRSLQIFECVARTGSTVKAAEELFVTQSAISHQIKQLSHTLGERLLQKSGRSLQLTERGAALARELTRAFSNIGESVDAIIGRNRKQVRLGACTSFSTGWLAPRIARFQALEPDITLDMLLYAADPDLSDSVADAFVTALPVPGGFTATDIVVEQLIAVASPGLGLTRFGATPKPLISTTAAEAVRNQDWLNFFTGNALTQDTWHNGQWLHCSHFVTALALAEARAGIALVPDYLAARAIQQGSLERLSHHVLETGRTYRLCIKAVRAEEPALLALRNWFTGEAASAASLKAAQ